MEYYNESLNIETIPLPLAGVLFSDSIHSIILKQYQIDAGVLLFEKNPHEFFINSVAGFENNRNFDDDLLSDLCVELTHKMNKRVSSTDPINFDSDNMLQFDKYLKNEKFISFKVFKISDYLNTSGYWFLFNENDKNPELNGSDFDYFPGSNNLVTAIRETIEQESTDISIDDIVNKWVKLLDYRDKETEAHTIRVARVATNLARELGLSEVEIESIKQGALLHDIGKLVIPNSILNKPGPLSDEEWLIMKLHPSIAIELLSGHGFPQEILDIPFFHHERWSGSGYPYQLKKEQIPLSARIFAIIDVWDALNSDRSYRKKLPKRKVDEYLIKKRGIDFDPDVVDSFLKLYGSNTSKSRSFFLQA